MAKKHLKVRAEYNAKGARYAKVRVTLLEQTDFLDNFGELNQGVRGLGKGCAFKSNNTVLYNVVFGLGNLIVYDYRPTVLYFHLSGCCGESIYMSLDQWKDIKPAIEAYNKWGETQ